MGMDIARTVAHHDPRERYCSLGGVADIPDGRRSRVGSESDALPKGLGHVFEVRRLMTTGGALLPSRRGV